ncbi:hypothetical protein D5F01_LYC01614 [Larimichthys crocea]|uniref:Ig-like domain-containing protein n=1 Tax=Larimichthys crocea TaxID=215358 RepID=A0A6G0J6Q5_LARCR|nr:hypothetical protein D5F01_LYC01614 [Larimichthys crocea]
MKRRNSMDDTIDFVGSIIDSNESLQLSDVSSLKDNPPLLGNEEVPLVTCTAAGSEPPAEVKGLTGCRVGLNMTVHLSADLQTPCLRSSAMLLICLALILSSVIEVPPVSSLKDNPPLLGNEEVPLVTCTAAGSKPPAEVKWLTGTLAGLNVTTTNVTHDNVAPIEVEIAKGKDPETLECSAKANPKADFTWSRLSTTVKD